MLLPMPLRRLIRCSRHMPLFDAAATAVAATPLILIHVIAHAVITLRYDADVAAMPCR